LFRNWNSDYDSRLISGRTVRFFGKAILSPAAAGIAQRPFSLLHSAFVRAKWGRWPGGTPSRSHRMVEVAERQRNKGSFAMADIVNLGDKLKAQREATARLYLTAKMIPIMVETVEKFAAIGAKPDNIVRFLQATIDEINSGKPG
jgi:hypothetical protein